MTAPIEAVGGPSDPPFLKAARAPLDLSRLRFPARLGGQGRRTVLDITKYFGPATGGIRTYLLAKARYVDQREDLRQVLVIPGAADALGQAGHVRCYRLRGPRIPFDPSYRFLLAARTTRKILEHERPDLIEVGSPWLVPWVTRRANRGLGAPMVWFYHTHFPSIIAPEWSNLSGARRYAGELAWRYLRRLAPNFRAVLVASESVARELERQGVNRVERVALGVELDRFHPDRRAERQATRTRFGLPDAPLALYLGRFTEEKQLETVLRAWPEIEQRTGAWLLLAGQGPREARLRALAEGASVRWIPYQRDRDVLADLHAAADLYVAPGPAETFGLAALEAMAAGTPVLSVDQGGVADRIRMSGAGALYAAGDAHACAEAATTLLRGDLAALGRVGRAYAERHHDWNVAFDGIFATYRRILGR